MSTMKTAAKAAIVNKKPFIVIVFDLLDRSIGVVLAGLKLSKKAKFPNLRDLLFGYQGLRIINGPIVVKRDGPIAIKY